MVSSVVGVVLAAGSGSRFDSEVPKHLVEFFGQPLLSRTLWQFVEAGVSEVIAVVPPGDERYDVDRPSQARLAERIDPPNLNATKFLEALRHVPVGRDALLIYGDVFFSKYAVKKILANSLGRESSTFFCRFQGSPIINAGWGEIFAIWVPSGGREAFTAHVNRVVTLFQTGQIWRDGGWEVAKSICDVPIARQFRDHLNLSVHFNIDDVTDDIDTWEDYERILKLVGSTQEDLQELYFENLREIFSLFEELGGTSSPPESFFRRGEIKATGEPIFINESSTMAPLRNLIHQRFSHSKRPHLFGQ